MSYYDRDYYGGGGGYNRYNIMPPVIKTLLIINVLVFFINYVLADTMLDEFVRRFGALYPIGHGLFYPWQVITYQFMHGGFSHILFNMLFLWMFGQELENLWGSRKFLVIYLLSGIGAGFAQLFLAPLFGQVGPTIGASGSVFGILVAYALFFPERYVYIYFLLPVKAKYLIAFLVVFEFFSVDSPGEVAHLAHIGGAVTGFLIIMAERRFNFSIDSIFDRFKSSGSNSWNAGNKDKPKSDIRFRNPFNIKKQSSDVQDASFYDINATEQSKKNVSQEEIDRILDKISQSGYQNLTEHEKRVLFEASKKN